MKNYRILITVTIVLCCISFNANAQVSNKHIGYEALEYEGMNYGFFKPSNYNEKDAYPLVIILNGFTDTLSHNFIYYTDSFQNTNPCFVLSPICHGNPYKGGGWVDPSTGLLLPDGKLAAKILDKTIQNYNIDEKRIYIHGGSMGGFGTFGFLSNYPEKFAAAYVVCGGAKIESAINYINTPLWIFHGQMDDVVPVHLSGNIYNELQKQGAENVRYTVYPGVKHNSWENVAKEKTLETWLFKQAKGKTAGFPETPKAVTIEKNKADNILTWELPNKTSLPDNDIWYYIILRNNEVLAEVDGDINRYNDKVRLDHEYYNYSIIAVNYYFKKSTPTKTVSVNK